MIKTNFTAHAGAMTKREFAKQYGLNAPYLIDPMQEGKNGEPKTQALPKGDAQDEQKGDPCLRRRNIAPGAHAPRPQTAMDFSPIHAGGRATSGRDRPGRADFLFHCPGNKE
jgi:hypothetical protein